MVSPDTGTLTIGPVIPYADSFISYSVLLCSGFNPSRISGGDPRHNDAHRVIDVGFLHDFSILFMICFLFTHTFTSYASQFGIPRVSQINAFLGSTYVPSITSVTSDAACIINLDLFEHSGPRIQSRLPQLQGHPSHPALCNAAE